MTIESLREVVRSDPFRPFTLRLADGRSIHVHNPDNVAFLGSGRTLFVAHPRSDRFELVDLLLINSVEVGGNGASRRRRAG
ncbi:MAG: hypothetical protein WD749_14670 [Phycisphaerales bacterium]